MNDCVLYQVVHLLFHCGEYIDENGSPPPPPPPPPLEKTLEYDSQVVTHIIQKCQNIKFPFNESDAKTNKNVKKFMMRAAFPRL